MQGELPTKAQMTEFEHEVTHHSMMRESLRQFLNGFHYDAHPMAMLCAVVGSLAAFYHDSLDNDDPKQRQPDISKAQSLLGWQPATPLKEGLKKTIAYFEALLREPGTMELIGNGERRGGV